MPRDEVTAILPCAGGGSRLGLPFPKELAPLGPGRAVIDSCLDLIREAAAACRVRVLLLEDGRREQTAAYIRQRLPGVPLACARQDPAARDWPDGVLALGPWLGHVNVVLLPDAAYEWAGNPVAETARNAVSHGSAVAAVKAGPGQVRAAGALKVRGDRVAAYEDKPAAPAGYDAVWGILAFGGGTFGLDALRQVAASTSRAVTGPVTGPGLPGAPVTWLAGFRDCGTWEGYAAELGTAR